MSIQGQSGGVWLLSNFEGRFKMLVVTYALALWLGLYLMRLGTIDAGLGLTVYAVGIAMIGLPGWWILTAVVPIVCWLLALRRLRIRLQQTRRGERWMLLVGSIFLALSVGSLLLPRLPRDVALVAVGLDLLLVGYAVAVLDSDNIGEVFLPAALRSLAGAAIVALIFGGQVGFAIVIEGDSPILRLLLLEVVGASIAVVVYAPAINNILDERLFPVAVGEARTSMRAVSEALPRAAESPELLVMDDATFAKHTRRALSNLNRPDKLAASPLMSLSLLHSESPLERVSELRTLLIDRVEHLRPENSDADITDEWRYYNALYYPYVVGLRPYSRRYVADDLDESARAILDWMRAQVPERTLYNWQNAAAELIAKDLRG
ncbi:MAG: hypothetical protein AAF787_12060 [Chloroflexota bacterium]